MPLERLLSWSGAVLGVTHRAVFCPLPFVPGQQKRLVRGYPGQPDKVISDWRGYRA